MNIDQFRQFYPQYNSVPDVELASRLHRKYYANSDFDNFADKFGVTVSQEDRGFFGKMAEAYTRGKDSTLADVAVARAVAGWGDLDTAKRIWKDARDKERVDPIDGNTLGDMIYGSSRMVGQIGQSLKAGGTGAVILGGLGAAGGAIVGAAIPTVGEEPFTMAAGAKIGLGLGAKWGMIAGTATFSYQQGAGMMYMNMLEQGADHKVAAVTAGLFALPYAAIESAQLMTGAKAFSTPAKGALDFAMNRSAKAIALRLGKKYATTFGKEITEELFQEAIQIVAEDSAQVFSGMGLDVDSTYLEQRMLRMIITAKESAIAMALLPAPGTAWNVSMELAVNQNLQEENGVESLKHEGHRSQVKHMDELQHLSEDQRDTLTSILESGLCNEIDTAVEMVQNFPTTSILLSSINPTVLKHNALDATTAVKYGSQYSMDTQAPVLGDTEMMKRAEEAKAVENKNVIGLTEANKLKKAFKKSKDFVTGFGLRAVRIRNMIRDLDGSEHGVLRTLILKPLRAGTSAGYMKRVLAVRNIRTALDETGVDLEKLYAKNVDIDGQVWNQVEMLEVFMAQFDRDKLRHLMNGNNVSLEQMNEVLAKINPKVAALGEWMLGEYENGYQSISEVYETIKGKKLKRNPGYSQIFIDEGKYIKNVDYADIMEAEQDRRGHRKRGVAADSTKERTRSIAPLRMDALSNFVEYKMQSEWYKAVAPAVFKVGHIFNDPDFQKAANGKTHGVGMELLSKWLQDIGSERATLETTWTGHMMNVLRKNGVVASLGLNVISMMRQPLSLFIAIGHDSAMKYKILGQFAKELRDPKAFREHAESKSKILRTRSMERELRRVWRSKDARSVLSRKPDISTVAMAPIQFMDKHTCLVLWTTAYEVSKDKGLSEEMSIDYADSLIEKTQPMADIMDLPAFYRGSTLEKSMTTFTNQPNQNLNYWYYDIIKAYSKGEISKKDVAHRVLFSFLLPAALMGMLARGRPVDQPEEAIKDVATYAAGTIPLVGGMVNGIIGGFDVRLPMGLGMFQEAARTVQSAQQGKWGKAGEYASGTIAQAVGLPWTQPKRTVKGLIALGDGETDDIRRAVWSKYALAKKEEKKVSKSTSRSRRGRKVRSRGR